MKNNDVWSVLLESIWDQSIHGKKHLVRGQNLEEWCSLSQHDYDSIDKMLIDIETIGG